MKHHAELSTGLLPLNEICSGRYFIIPDYQRGFSWDTTQLEDLTKDIDRLLKKDHMHFTGTLVLSQPDLNQNIYEIIDGQQRLTSLIILIKAIYDTNPSIYSDLRELYLLRGKIGNVRPVLTSNAETREFFNDVILEGRGASVRIKSHEHLQVAFDYFKEWLKKNASSIDNILKVVTQQIGFLLFTPEHQSEVGIMFEVINNRGKRLSALEKIKNYFIYYAAIHDKHSLRQTINDKWRVIQENLNHAHMTENDDENNFLRNCYLVFFEPNKTKSWRVYEELKEELEDKDQSSSVDEHTVLIQQFVNFLAECSLYYAYFYNSRDLFSNDYKGRKKHEIGKILNLLNCQRSNASIMPLYLAIMSRLSDAPEKVLPLLEILEKLNFRVYILPKITSRADSMQGDLFRFANEFYHDPDWHSEKDKEKYLTEFNKVPISGDVFDWLRTELIEFCKYFCPEKKFVESLTLDQDESDDYYTWPGLKYFLGNYEIMLQAKDGHSWNIENIIGTRISTKENPNDYLSVEHIWAAGNLKEHFDRNHHEKRRLGNFVLLGLNKNQQLQDKSIPDKIKELIGINSPNKGSHHLYHVAELEEIEKCSEVELKKNRQRLTKEWFHELATRIHDLRETRLIEFALERWKMPYERMGKFDRVDSFNSPDGNISYILKA